MNCRARAGAWRGRRLLCGLEQVEVGGVCQKPELFGETEQGIATGGPRHYGFDLEYRPFSEALAAARPA